VPVPDLSIIVPCYNEAANLPELVSRLQTTYADMQVAGETILVDDASRDETYAVMQQLQGAHPELRVARHPQNKGLFAGWRTGIGLARSPYVGVIDADLQYQPEDLARLWEHLKWSHCDVAQGARFNVTEKGGLRFWMSRGTNALLNFTFRMSLHDNKSGFFITRREIAADMLDYRGRYAYPQTFVMVSANTKGYSIGELRTVFAPRKQGVSFMGRYPFRVAVLVAVDIVRAIPEFAWSVPRITYLAQCLKETPPARAPRARSQAETRKMRRYQRLMPVHHWMITRAAGEYFDQLERTQWYDVADIKRLQNERLQQMVRHAYQHVPFYRRRMDRAGINPAQVRSIEDLSQLPPLTKDDVRRHLHYDLLADNMRIGDLYPINTSGSTGEPLSTYVDRPQLEMRWAATLRSQEWTGYRFGDPTVRLWHQTIGMSKSQIVKEQIDAWLTRRLFIPAWRMTSANLSEVVKKIVAHRPTMIDGYAESFHLMAESLADGPLTCPSLRGLMSSAQTLSHRSREIIERTFGCRVFDKYGAREFSGIAYECDQHDGYHVVAENYIVEIMRDGRPVQPGEIGEVFVTDLNNRCMPFLRYRLGDLARAASDEPCACGRGLPRVAEIMGRTQSIIIGADNQFLPGSFFAHLLKDYDYAIRQFQVVQQDRGAIELRIVKAGRFSQSVLDEIQDRFRQYLGRNMRIDVRFLDQIPLGRTGKFQHSVSQLRFDFQTSRVEPIEVPRDASPSPLAAEAVHGAGHSDEH
jgi:phenylacetate-CoA ligase